MMYLLEWFQSTAGNAYHFVIDASSKAGGYVVNTFEAGVEMVVETVVAGGGKFVDIVSTPMSMLAEYVNSAFGIIAEYPLQFCAALVPAPSDIVPFIGAIDVWYVESESPQFNYLPSTLIPHQVENPLIVNDGYEYHNSPSGQLLIVPDSELFPCPLFILGRNSHHINQYIYEQWNYLYGTKEDLDDLYFTGKWYAKKTYHNHFNAWIPYNVANAGLNEPVFGSFGFLAEIPKTLNNMLLPDQRIYVESKDTDDKISYEPIMELTPGPIYRSIDGEEYSHIYPGWYKISSFYPDLYTLVLVGNVLSPAFPYHGNLGSNRFRRKLRVLPKCPAKFDFDDRVITGRGLLTGNNYQGLTIGDELVTL